MEDPFSSKKHEGNNIHHFIKLHGVSHCAYNNFIFTLLKYFSSNDDRVAVHFRAFINRNMPLYLPRTLTFGTVATGA